MFCGTVTSGTAFKPVFSVDRALMALLLMDAVLMRCNDGAEARHIMMMKVQKMGHLALQLVEGLGFGGGLHLQPRRRLVHEIYRL